ncbi:MAG: hypothetical protein V4671_16950 [Armatimonadota bacterium]
MKNLHYLAGPYLAGPFTLLAALSLTTLCYAQNPLVGKWTGIMAGIPTRLEYKSDGKATADLLNVKPTYVINLTYTIKGNTVQQTTVGQTISGKTKWLPVSNRGTQKYQFKVIDQDTLTLKRSDGFSATLKRDKPQQVQARRIGTKDIEKTGVWGPLKRRYANVRTATSDSASL